ncbi:hypothetical protein QRX60_21335 [Amycolatopsis mongoliensis]|uniref:4Fe-4S Mo/W bis-MGD-type domain-containing protein n=1 Tax=Amycolatopsis mongoliensis TaxID=715475 RepID=A0A9Y2JX23_9PSEU|nr:hypothetical protein [Amycolatopsis sp. 4-36]WIY06260.1 hypothetical protein QRX60_21335 [Amycolatopsis sp. 4-36]
MGEWHRTACSLCYLNCGLEVQLDGRKITRVRGDKAHPRSGGYLCQKAQRLTWYGDHEDRLTTPLRRRQPLDRRPGPRPDRGHPAPQGRPARLEPATGEERTRAETDSARVRETVASGRS